MLWQRQIEIAGRGICRIQKDDGKRTILDYLHLKSLYPDIPYDYLRIITKGIYLEILRLQRLYCRYFSTDIIYIISILVQFRSSPSISSNESLITRNACM